MAIFERLKVVEPNSSELVTIYQNINCVTGSIAINDEFHDLLISINGTLHGPLGAGRYSLDPAYSPFFTRLRNFATGGKPPINVSVFYISKQNFTQQWGTGEIVCNENVIKIPLPIRVAAGGTMIFKINNSKLFMKSLVGLQAFNVDDLSASTKSLIIPQIRDTIVSRMSSSNFASSQIDTSGISQTMFSPLANALNEFGITLTKFAVTCFNVNKEDLDKLQQIHEQRIAKATEIEALANEISTIYNGSAYDRAKVEALINFSKSQGDGSSMSQLAMFPILMNIGQQMSAQMGDMFAASARTPHPTPLTCAHCHGVCETSHRFCPHCGHQIN